MKIGFTVGAWDHMHHGHRRFLEAAAKSCDYLVVGVMTDFWCRVQKGPERPVHSLAKRMAVLRKLQIADKVIALDTLDMSPYLQMADVWIKGEDQLNMRPLEFPNCIYIPRTPNISTTAIISGLGAGTPRAL